MKKMNVISKLMSLVLVALVLYSCEESGLDSFSSDFELISAIEGAELITVDESTLPASAAATLDAEYSTDLVAEVKLADGLGYQVEMVRAEGTYVGEESTTFFAEDGRELDGEDDRPRRPGRKRRLKFLNDCFDFVYPLTLTMPDGSESTLETKEDWVDVRDWLKENKGEYEERPEFIYPVEIEFEDGGLFTIGSSEELREVVSENCERPGFGRARCFEFVYPISFTMPDGSLIEIASKDDRDTLKAWHEANPDVDERGTLNFPVDVIYGDSTVTLGSEEELKDIASTCERKRDRERCYQFVFPFTLNMPDGTSITLESETDWELVKEWHDANPDSEERPTLAFPVEVELEDGSVVEVTDEEELKELRESCRPNKRD